MLVPHGRTVLTLVGTPDDLHTRSLIAAQIAGPPAVLTGPSALAVRQLLDEAPWDALDPGLEPWLIHPSRTRIRARVVRRDPPAATTILGVRVATAPAAMIDALRLLPAPEARSLCHRAAQTLGHAPMADILAAAKAELRGRVGSSQLHELAAELDQGAHSEAERRLIRILTEAGITGFLTNFKVRLRGRMAEVDVAFPAIRLAIEVDGMAWHTSPRRFQEDRSRQNALTAEGWTVLRFTWADLRNRPAQVVATIAALLP
jgi:very-short-patch-repair endonuclease